MKKFLPAILANLSAAFSEILLMTSAIWLIVKSSTHPQLSELSIGITLVRTAGISRAVLRYADRFFSHKSIFQFLDNLREELFIKITKNFPLKSGKTDEGKLLHDLIVETDLKKDFLPRVILPITTALFVTIFLTVLLKNFLPIIIFFVNVILSWIYETRSADDSIYREKILDFYEGRDELKIFGKTPAVKSLNSSAENFAKSQEKIFNRQINFDTLIKFLNIAGIFFILQNLEADRIYFAVWIFILLSAFEIYSAIPAAISTYKKISAKNFELENTKKIPETSTNYAIEFKNVSFSYDDKNFILKDFNFKLERGEKICIIGESGAGKTTLLYLIMKLFYPDSGNISVNGKVCASTFDNFIFSKSIRYNFEFFNEEISDSEMNEILKICQLENFNIDEEIGENGNFLSGGEKVRLQIALALAKNPEILILDEPTAGLDKICGKNLISNIISDSAKKNRALIIITHDSDIAKKFYKKLKIN